MGKKIILTGTTLTDTDAPQLAVIDLIESAGSLLLIEPMHPYAQWSSGVPSNGATIPNLLKDTLSTGDATFALTGGINDNTKGKIERSAKGGLHGIVSQSSLLSSGDGARILIPSALRSYAWNHLSNNYYISIWDRLTRANANTSQWAGDYAFASATTNGFGCSNPVGWVPPTVTDSRLISVATGPRFANLRRSGVPMAASTSMDASGTPQWGAVTGTYNAAVIASRNDKWTSFVFYRLYIEDLTVSGRTYAEVDAIDYALYTKHVLTAGGRYYGDTFTDPATLV